MIERVLGLDVNTNVVGWAAVDRRGLITAGSVRRAKGESPGAFADRVSANITVRENMALLFKGVPGPQVVAVEVNHAGVKGKGGIAYKIRRDLDRVLLLSGRILQAVGNQEAVAYQARYRGKETKKKRKAAMCFKYGKQLRALAIRTNEHLWDALSVAHDVLWGAKVDPGRV